MLGSFENSLGTGGVESIYGRPLAEATRRKTKKPDPNQLIEQEWSELPYAMMRLTAARRPWDGKRIYWRDQNVQLGEIDMNLVKIRTQRNGTTYTASYTHNELRRDFPLKPSLEDNQLRWSALDISDVQLTTNQLAEKLLARLVTFYTTGLA